MDQVKIMILIAPIWQEQPWYPELLRLSKQLPFLISWKKDHLKSPLDQVHLLVEDKILTLAAWIIMTDNYAIQAFRSKLPHLSQAREEGIFYQITSHPGRSGLAGVLDKKLIHSNVLKFYYLFSRLLFQSICMSYIRLLWVFNSAYYAHVGGKPVGQQNAESVLNFIENSWGSSENLADKDLTCKVTMLMALTSASRASAIHFWTLLTTPHEYIFTFQK